jgi:isopentenyl diphosphate isomerase/L-lactate dehydrogenase-like FMN-dependent dehydrogenase
LDRGRLERQGYSVAALRKMARRRLPRMVFDFCDGGSEDEITRARNETAFADWELLPTPLNGTADRDQSVVLFGERLALPVIIGPTGLSGMLWPQGELAAARAAAAAGTVYTMSHGSTVAIEDLAKATSGLLWFQNFMFRDRGLTRSLAERAQAAGYRALVLTVDNQVLGQRERDLANGFVIPPHLSWRSMVDVARALPWALRMARAPLTFVNYVSEEKKDIVSLAVYIADMLDPTLCWKDVDWLRGLWRGPLLLKGVLHPDEARRALDHGIDGVIVSNHGGRQLDTAVPAIRALPGVADAVAGRIPVLLDGGVRRGSHVVKAVALGATACLIGRPHLWGLAVAGEAGVAQVLEVFRRDIDRVLALCGWDGIGEVDRGALVPAGAAAEPALERARDAEAARASPRAVAAS